MRNIGIALFINTSLFLGGLHQWLYVNQIKLRMGKWNANFYDFTRNNFNGTSSKNYSL